MERTKLDVLVAEIRRRIVAGEYPRDARLRQDDLALTFGTSITPVREALRLLETEGLVVSAPHKGVRVAAIDIEAVRSGYVVRRLTESFAVRRAVPRLSRLDLLDLERMLEVAPGAGGARSDGYEANRLFHFGFYDRCDVPGLSERIATMWTGFPWDMLLADASRAAESAVEHRAVLDAAAAGDAAGAALAMEGHLASGLRALEAHLGASDADPFVGD